MQEITRDVVAIVRLSDYGAAAEVIQALQAGGISFIELTLTGKGALEGLTRAKKVLSKNTFLGIGSVRSIKEAEESCAAGADFLVTPICIPEIIARCGNVPVAMGSFTPTEAARAHDAGAKYVKIFPARSLGAKFIGDVLAPLPHLKLIPTGGIDLISMKSFFDAGAVGVGIGGNLVPQKAVDERNFDLITATAKSYVDALQ